ncbi:MAG: nucleotidyltransferase domain-containing protein [Candidatus Aenigmarchaeota archaeon]|nr:nucleotidyltransferase domain-containing protein [Candidatus Aenigmarchaeota archaeon]
MTRKKNIPAVRAGPTAIPFGTRVGFGVARVFFAFPNKTFHLRELAHKTGFSTTAVSACIEELKTYGIVRIVDNPLAKDITANTESQKYTDYKRVFNLYQLSRGFVDVLRDLYTPEAIVVFGSFAKGEDIEESDIDLLVITNRKRSDAGDVLRPYEVAFSRKIDLHVLPSLDHSPAEFKNAVANGVVLHGYVKVV